jgi:hypothetical protein
MMHGTAPLLYARKYHCCYASRRNTYQYRNSHDAVMARYAPYMVQTVSVPGVFSSALGDSGYIFRSPDMDLIEEIVRFIQETQ